MQTFLQIVSDQLVNKCLSGKDKIIFPNKRSASLCKNAFVEKNPNTFFLPEFITIEDFICEWSGLQMADPLDLKFLLYKHYVKIYDKSESIDQVFSWANQLINDFSEIDRNLIDEKDLLGYLKAIKEIEHWSKTEQPTEMIKKYLYFWNKLPVLYENYTTELLEQGLAYQGLVYRKAVNYLKENISNLDFNFYFIGFNALNKAEEVLFQLVLEENKGKIFWDIDAYYWQSKHSASFFLRQYQQQWKVLQNSQHAIQPTTSSFASDKDFSIYSNQGNIQQAKTVGEIIDRLDHEKIKKTAVLLGDESILESLMFSIPNKVESINITMGLSLNKTSIGAFLMNYMQSCIADQQTFFHKDLLLLVESGFLMHLFRDDCKKVRDIIINKQHFFLKEDEIREVCENTSADFQAIFLQLFTAIPDKSNELNKKIHDFLNRLLAKTEQTFSIILIKKNIAVIQKMETYLSTYEFEIGLNAYLNLFKEVVAQEQIDLRGEKDKGLQIMGLLESRCLDFENLIITSVNEGILPKGKTAGSFIPFDLKKQYQLPTYQEKDKVYSYHFFRILQRAAEVHLLYNDLSNNLSFSEESRFIKILEENQLENHQINRYHVALNSKPYQKEDNVPNSHDIQKVLKDWMIRRKVSASALISYVRNPYIFYQKYILGLQDPFELKDLESANLFGQVVHDSLEDLYNDLPFQKNLTEADIEGLIAKSEPVIKEQVLKRCGNKAFEKGSNILGFEAIKKQIDLLLKEEKQVVKEHELQILAIEKELTCELETDLFDQPVKLQGKIDRVDQLNGVKRIVDYKTGASKSLNISQLEDLITDEKKSHAFQTLFYSLLEKKLLLEEENWQAGNIYLKEKDKRFKALQINKQDLIDHTQLKEYTVVLRQLLQEIYDVEIPFRNKEMVS